MLALPVVVLLGAACTTEVRNEGGAVAEPSLSVTGEGRVSAAADVAVLDVGVSVVRDSVGEARADAAEAMEAVRASLRASGVADGDVVTVQFNVFPEFDFREEGQTLRGFRVTNVVSARIRDIDDASRVIDEAIVTAGDNVVVNNISFTIDDSTALADQARELAIEDARRKAQVLADLAEVELGDLLNVGESGGAGPPALAFAEAALPRGGGGPTPIDGGEVTVALSVFLTFAIE